MFYILFFQIDDDEQNEQNDANFYKRVDAKLPSTQKIRIVGAAHVQKKEKQQFRSSSADESDEESCDEDGGRKLNFKPYDILPEGEKNASREVIDLSDDEEIVEDDTLETGVTMIRNKDGTTKMVFSGNQSDIVKKMQNNIREKLKKSKENKASKKTRARR